MASSPITKFNPIPIFLKIKFYWNMRINLPIVYGCFCATMDKLSNCDRLCGLKTQNIYSLALYKQSLPTSGIKSISHFEARVIFQKLKPDH